MLLFCFWTATMNRITFLFFFLEIFDIITPASVFAALHVSIRHFKDAALCSILDILCYNCYRDFTRKRNCNVDWGLKLFSWNSEFRKLILKKDWGFSLQKINKKDAAVNILHKIGFPCLTMQIRWYKTACFDSTHVEIYLPPFHSPVIYLTYSTLFFCLLFILKLL